jgi:hypothetical protein
MENDMTGKALQAWGLVVFIVLFIIFCYRHFGPCCASCSPCVPRGWFDSRHRMTSSNSCQDYDERLFWDYYPHSDLLVKHFSCQDMVNWESPFL